MTSELSGIEKGDDATTVEKRASSLSTKKVAIESVAEANTDEEKAAEELKRAKEPRVQSSEAAVAHDAATAPTPKNLSGRRVRIDGLKGRPELNGRCGVAGRFDAAKGRYEVAVEGEAEAVLLKPANLQEICAHPIPTPN